MTRVCPHCGSTDLFWHCRVGSGPATCNRCKALADTDTPIRSAIASAMVAKGVSQSALSRATGVGQGRISRYLAGKAHLRSDAVERIVVELGVKVKGATDGK